MDIIEIESSESDDDLDVEWDDSPEEWPTDHSGGLDMNSFRNPPSSSNNDRASHPENSVSSSRQWRETFDTDLHNNSRSNEGEGTSSLSDGENFQGRVLPPSFRSYAYKPSSDHSSSRFNRGSISNLHKEPTQVKPSNGSAVDLTNIAYDRNKLDNKMYQNTQSRILPPSFQQTMHASAPKGPVDYKGRKVFDIEDKHKFPPSASVNANAGGGARMLPPSFRSDKSSSVSTPGATVDDDVLIYRTSGTHRILPPTLNGKSFDNSQLAVSADARTRSGLGEQRIMEHDERAIYQEALQNLGQPKLEDDLPEGLLSVSLLKHQKIALAWMVLREKSVNGAGGILADDQGLGKTISMIALVQKQRPIQSKFTSDDSQQTKSEALNLDDDDDEGIVDLDKEKQVENLERKHVPSTSIRMSSKWRRAAGTLVVCPASVLRQWARELDEKVTTSAKLSVLIYHGGARTRDPADLAKYDVVLTTYAIVSNEVPKQAIAQDDEGDQRNLDKYEISSEFSSKKRKQETGRPSKGKKKGKRLKDSDVDYDCGPLARVRWFRVILDEAQTIKNHRTQVARACCGLRAKRRWCLSGTPIQNSIDDLFSYFRFLKYEPYSSYSSFCNKIKYPISKSASDGYKKLQVVLRNLLLRRTKGTLINGEPIINLPPKTVLLNKVEFSSEERLFYLKLEADSRQQFKKYAAAGTLKQNYASILLMLLRLRQACDHPVLVKGCHSDTTRTDSLEMARQLPRDMLSNLLSHLEGSLAICSVCSDPPEDAVVTMCGHVFCYQCVSERLTGDDNQCPAAGCKQTLGIESVFSRATLESCICDKTDSSASTSGLTHEEEPSIAQSAFVSSKIKAALGIINSLCSSSCNSLSREYSKQDCDMVDIGAKMDACSYESTNIEVPIKAIVFSQWTGMLDLLEHSLNQSLIQYRRLDGTMSIALRDKAVKEFNTDPEVTVMLMSLKAGNLGLNMVAACHVIMLDLWWNPTSEDQAVDRAHRIGQTRPVTVSRLTVKDTVEDRILALQEDKRKMVSSAFGEDQSSGHATKLTLEDVRYLFGFN